MREGAREEGREGGRKRGDRGLKCLHRMCLCS